MKSYRICQCGNRATGIYCSKKCYFKYKFDFELEADKELFESIATTSYSINQIEEYTGLPRDTIKFLIETYGVKLRKRYCFTCGKELESNKNKQFCNDTCRRFKKCHDTKCKYSKQTNITSICGQYCLKPQWSKKKTNLKQICCFCGTNFIASARSEYKTCSFDCLVKLTSFVLEEELKKRGSEDGKEA